MREELFKVDKIKSIHLEPTTKCNAACPMCARNYRGKTREKLDLIELSIDDIKQILTSQFLRQIEFISICGVFGDPANATDIIKIVDYIYACNSKIKIHFYTNGSIHDEAWWRELARSLKNGYVIFGIDGAGKTSERHRVNTTFERVLENADAFIAAGGKAKWDFIVFRHNEAEVETARLLASSHGFKEFNIKKTGRFFKNTYEHDGQLDSTICEYGRHPVFNNKGEIIDYLELPINEAFRNSCESDLFDVSEVFGGIDNYLDQVEIKCDSLKTGGIFISASGEIFPCCTVYQQVWYGKVFGVTDTLELNEYRLYLSDELSALKRPLKDIIEGDFFSNLKKNMHLCGIINGKPKSCSRTCGSYLNIHNAQHR